MEAIARKIDFVPSQVELAGMFVGTFDHLEAENTAAVIVKVLSLNGDTWRSATCEELAAGFELLVKDPGPWRQWFDNPFVRIDMHDLVKRGFAEWDGEKAIRFTDKGLWRMAKWLDWRPIASAPQGEGWHVQWIMGKLPDGSQAPVHYAFGDGEGLMPPFRGWFRKCGEHDMCGVDPTHWRPLTDEELAKCQ